jgi:superfamily II DNA or RNA helicase
MTTFAKFFETFDADIHVRGTQFERVCAWFLQTDPRYAGQIEEVWLWDDWPGRWGPDCGIDVVARDKTGRIWAIQAKAHGKATTVTKHMVDSFLSETSRPEIQVRLLIQSTDRLAKNAERVIRAQDKDIHVLRLHDLHHAPIDWPTHVHDLTTGKVRDPWSPKPHQEKAITAVMSGFKTHDRGQLIMACGTGKTLTALWIKERERCDLALVLLPSLSLLSQTVTEWMANAAEPFAFLPVCSDETVSKGTDAAVLFKSDLVFPVTTNPADIADFLRQDGPRVVFSTYQSSARIAEAQTRANVPAFDVIIADEAHRCAGKVSSDYGNVLDAQRIRGDKRLFMTATPRIFTNKIVKQGKEVDIEIASMDNEVLFGPVLHRLPFGEAITLKLLTNYQVAVIGVDDEMYQDWVTRRAFVQTETDINTDAKHLAAQIGLAKAIKRFDLRRLISFHSRVQAAQDFTKSFKEVVAWMPADTAPDGEILCGAVHGKMSTHDRNTKLQTLRSIGENERGLLANARCLSEGVDVPTLDGVAFIDPRSSQVDIVQAVGRAIRLSEGKSKGTIVLPVFLGDLDDHDEILSGSAFKPIWDVLKALRCHDEALADQLDHMRTQLGRTGTSGPLPDNVIIDFPTRVSTDFADAFTTRLVEATTASFEFGLGVLQAFVEREGHARVHRKHKEPFDSGLFNLGSWVSSRRNEKNNNRLLKERIVQLNALGFDWDPLESNFQEGLKALRQFIEREGHARATQIHKEFIDGSLFSLGVWLNRQRIVRKKDDLSKKRIDALNALGFEWRPKETDFQEGLKALRQFTERENHARVPRGHKEFVDGRFYNLGRWVGHRRNDIKNNTLSKERIAALNALRFDWDPYETDFQEGLKALRQFIEREGHVRAPQNYKELLDGSLFNLGDWVADRRKYRKKNKLSKERIATLDALEFDWDPHETVHQEGLKVLRQFIEREGHVLVPRRHTEFLEGQPYNLGQWVVGKRIDKNKDRLSEKYYTELDTLGFDWDPYETAFQESIKALRQYIGREGHARVPSKHKEILNGQIFKLGGWVSERRKSRRKDRLSEERIAQLDALGFDWNPKD